MLAVVCLVAGVATLGSASAPCDGGAREVVGPTNMTDGSVVAEDGTRYPPGCWWRPKGGGPVQGCPSVSPCVWECCPPGHLLTFDPVRCEPAVTPPAQFDLGSLHLLYGNPCPGQRYMIDEGLLGVTDAGVLQEVVPESYCFEHPGYAPGQFCLAGRALALICEPDKEGRPTVAESERREEATFVIYTVARVVALPFLVATVAVYLAVPELRNLHGRCLVCHVTCLVVGYVAFIVTTVARGWLNREAGACVALGFIAYFSMLGSFFWLNVMCFDIWWTFSGHRRLGGARDSTDCRRFLVYSGYAWGGPIILLAVTLFMQFSRAVPDSLLRPSIGTCKCWFKDKRRVLAYFGGPVNALLCCNIVFFVVTAFHIVRTRRQTAALSGQDSRRVDQRKNNEKRFALYLKLFLVMGVTWCLDQLGWAVGGPDQLWWVTDVANILQAVLIFLIFVCKARVRRLLRQRCCGERAGAGTSPPNTLATFVNGTSTGTTGG